MSTKRRQRHLRWHLPRPFHQGEHEHPLHDPPLAPHDEAIFLLHSAAEVEHALMVQYLYAAYSLKKPTEVPPEHQASVRKWRSTILGIAREEMGHLITVQNLLRLIGGPVILDREDYPFRSDLYPFHFRLEPLSKASLARYVLAEMPLMPEPPEEIEEIKHLASCESSAPINRVGALYVRVAHILAEPPPLGDPEEHIPNACFRPEVDTQQARYEEWGNGHAVLVPRVRNRDEALAAIEELSEQGEGLSDALAAPSHYQRFLALYREFPEAGDWQATNDVPIDPNTEHSPGRDAEAGAITHPQSRLWAQLFNIRYRMLLTGLSHFLQTEGPLIDEEYDRTARGYLNKWTFDEMRRVAGLAARLASMPRKEGQDDAPERAGAPFELPYTLAIPDREPDRWRLHIDLVEASADLIRRIQKHYPDDEGAALLQDLLAADAEAEQVMRAANARQALPPQPGAFIKVVRILEESVRGFHIGAHHNFWRGVTRDEFVNLSVFGNPLLARTGDGGFDAENSNLVKALRGEAPFDGPEEGSKDYTHFPRMPAHHPPVPPAGTEFVRRWIADGCPDSDPPGQVGIMGEGERAAAGK